MNKSSFNCLESEEEEEEENNDEDNDEDSNESQSDDEDNDEESNESPSDEEEEERIVKQSNTRMVTRQMSLIMNNQTKPKPKVKVQPFVDHTEDTLR